ncbi:MAG: class I adenylate-forming enzyme family protein [Candidatus Omnitrophota bacterium]
MDIRERLKYHLKAHPDKTAVIFRKENISFRQLAQRAFRLANAFAANGLKQGEKVAVYLPNWPQYIYTYLGAWCSGATVVPLDFMLTQEEIISCLSHAQAKALVIKPKANLSLDAIREACPQLKVVISCSDTQEGCLLFEDLIEKGDNSEPNAKVDEKDCAIIFYTSGTTGRPKGVIINYRQLEAPPKGMEYFVPFREDEMSLCALPFSHLGGLIYIEVILAFGTSFVLMERFMPLEFLRNVQEHRINWFWMVPSMYYALLQLKEFERFDLSSLRWIVTFGASNSPEALRRFHQYCPDAQLLNGWGMTETNAPSVVLSVGSTKIESVGRPVPWIEVKILDNEDRELPAGSIGEIAVRGWSVTEGYYRDPESTSQAMRNGWFHTGDLGRFDEEGDLYIVGRKKEMIKVSGEIVFEPEIEAVLQRHPKVHEAAVIGVPDRLRGELPKAFLVLKPGEEADEEELRYFCRKHLAHFKIPHIFEFVPSLPKNRAGKIDKESLRNPARLKPSTDARHQSF